MTQPASISFTCGPLTVRIEGDHPATAWAAGVFGACRSEAPADVVFAFGDSLDGALVDAGRHFQVRIDRGSAEGGWRVNVRPRDRRPLWLAGLAQPDDLFKAWRTYGTGLSTPRLKAAAYDVLPGVLEMALLERGATFVHAAAVERGGRALLIVADRRVGKTSLMLAAMRDASTRYLADDLAIVEERGGVHHWPMPMNLTPHHASLDVETARRIAGPMSACSRLHWIVGGAFWRARVSRWLRPADVFGAARIAASAMLIECVLLERGQVESLRWEPIDAAQAAERCARWTASEINGLSAMFAQPGAVDAMHRAFAAALAGRSCAVLTLARSTNLAAAFDELRRRSIVLGGG